MLCKPLAIDLFCGLGGWTDGLLAEGYDVIGFDIEHHKYGDEKYPALLVIQDVLTLHGSQFKSADLIVASPPCQEYSYMAMPWKKAKAKAEAIRADKTGRELERLNRLFNACFRIQREACEAAGRHIPLIIENVRGANEWVGRARWNFGSYYLWGDVPALMPATIKATKVPGFRFDGNGGSLKTAAVNEGFKSAGLNWSDQTKRGQDFTRVAGAQALADGIKVPTSGAGRRTAPGSGARFTSRDCGIESAGRKNGNDWFGSGEDCSLQRKAASGSKARKAASAMIAKIPIALSRHIARVYRPMERVA